jgi:lantibiotic modifying enzyme
MGMNLPSLIQLSRSRRVGLPITGTGVEGISDAIAAIAWADLMAKTPLPKGLRDSVVLREEFRRSLSRRLRRTGHSLLANHGDDFGNIEERFQPHTFLEWIISQYPGLAQIWTAQLNGWGSFVNAFANHLTAFWRTAEEHDVLEAIETDLSDSHNGRSVTRVLFGGGNEWIYKPRSAKRELAWYQFLAALNGAGFALHFLIPEVQSRNAHCWSRKIDRVPCRTDEELGSYQYRAGATLCLAHIFRAVDLHAENFVTHGEHPVLVDCETLFHPETPLPAPFRLIERGLFRTGMIGTTQGQNARPLINVTDRPVAGSKSNGLCYRFESKKVMRGFSAMEEFMAKHASNVQIKKAIKHLRNTKTRYIYRPTLVYDRILTDALSSTRLLSVNGPVHRMRQQLNDGLCDQAVVRQEIHQLLKGDIPRFHGKATGLRKLR